MTPAPSPLILGAWAAITLCLLGIGLLFRHVCRAPVRGAHDLLLCFWIGWLWLLFFLQIWQMRYPVDTMALGMALIVAHLGVRLAWRDVWNVLRRSLPAAWPVVVVSLLVALWLSNRALGGPQNGDSGLYHAPVVRWYADYPLIVGLGNLNSRYALNQSYFLFNALLDIGPFRHGSHHLANGVLLLPLLLRSLLAIWHLLGKRRAAASLEWYYALFFPAAVDLALHINLTSPSPDIVVFVLGVFLCGQVIDLIGRVQRQTARPFDLVVIALLAVGAFTVKLSLAGMGLMAFLVAAGSVLARGGFGRAEWRRTAGLTLLITVIGIGPWIARNLWLSGYPFYPSLIGGLWVPWRVPYGWAAYILPRSSWWWNAVADPQYALQRLRSFGWSESSIVMPLVLALVTAFLILLLRLRRGAAPNRLPAAILLPPLVSLMVNGLSASMARYVGSAAWLLAVQTIVLFQAHFAIEAGKLRRAVAIVCLLGWLPMLHGRPLLRQLSTFEPVVSPRIRVVTLASGVKLNLPLANQGCWYAEPPCSSDVNRGLIREAQADGSFRYRSSWR